jgi:spore coat protein H
MMKTIFAVCLACLASLVSVSHAAQSQSVFGQRNAGELFDIDHVPEFAITLPKEQWEWLQVHATEKTHVQAEARFDGQPAGSIGLRFKGGVGTLDRCVDKTGKLLCAKLSLRLTFDKYDRANRFFGLKDLNLHSLVHDPTKIRQHVAYDIFRLSGIQAPRSSWATATINGKSYGLFAMVEEVDDVFVADRWPGNGKGNLYKEVWPNSTDAAGYVKGLETNKATPNTDAMVGFARDLSAGDPAQLGAALAKWTDPVYMARYMAVDDAIRNCDGVTAMYTADEKTLGSSNHNYFWYQEPNRDVFWLIPWDTDQAFTGGCDTFAAVPRWNDKPENCEKTFKVWDDAFVRAPGCDRLFQAIAMRRADYDAAVDKLLAGPFAQQTVLDKIDRWTKFIYNAQIADPTTGGAGGKDAWINAVEDLKRSIPVLRERLKKLRAAR